MSGMDAFNHHRGGPSDGSALGAGFRATVLVAIVTMGAAALLLVLGGWQGELCSALRAGYPLCAL